MGLSGIECPQLHWDGENLEENWRRFKQHVELMLSGPLKSHQEADYCSYLLIWVGRKGRDIYNTWSNNNNNNNFIKRQRNTLNIHTACIYLIKAIRGRECGYSTY